jgi:hypothetical protein
MERISGRVMSVTEDLAGSTLVGSISAGATTLPLVDATFFVAEGGQALVGDDTTNEVVTYDSVDLDADEIHLTAGLVNGYDDDDPVVLWPLLRMRYAQVQPTGSQDDTLQTAVPSQCWDVLPVGTREDAAREQVVLEADAETAAFVVRDVYSNAESLEDVAADPGSDAQALSVTDDTTEVSPTSELAFDPYLFIVDDDGGGRAFVSLIEGGGITELQDLADVSPTLDTDAADGDVLTWDDSGGLWVPTAPSGGDVDYDLGRASPNAAPGGGSDDEFDDASIAGAWVQVDPPGTDPGGWAEKYDRILFRNTAQASAGGRLSAIVKPISLSTGDFIETFIETGVRADFQAAGLIMSDGHTSAAGTQVRALVYSGNLIRVEGGTNFSSATSEGTAAQPFQNARQPIGIFLRLKYESANTWGIYYSLDGFEWVAIQTNFSYTLTPSEIGLGVYHHSPSTPPQGWHRFSYIRLNPANE